MQRSAKQPVLCLMGPTASGKTDLAIRLSQRYGLSIVSVDSAMVYRGLDIGTAKPSAELRALIPHQLIDIRDPSQPYSVGEFCRDAHLAIQAIHQQGKIPLLVGGTMLYFWALQYGLAELPASDERLRQQIYQQAAVVGWPAMHEQLQVVDPVIARQLHPQDSQRISRAWEVYQLTGQPLSELQQRATNHQRQYDWIPLVLLPASRSLLHERIALRLVDMFAVGLVDEVQQLFDRGDLLPELPAMRTVGYRQVWSYLAGECNADTMQNEALFATRQLAKRQITWLKRWPTAYQISLADVADLNFVEQLI